MNMNVILLDNLKSLGKLGDTVAVKPGYARNYLLPTGKAVRANKENIAYYEAEKEKLAKKIADRLTVTKVRAEKLEGLELTVLCRASDEGKLYGSVGAQEIVKAISEKGIEAAKQEVLLPLGPFRQIGEYEVQLSLEHGELLPKIKLIVEAESEA